ncbi:MAG: FKBP-type peptidyl-prolyl cis-trans isomerase [Bacteroidales bacterium]|nr:FKBP-type peptidyl-prolyl cis-trans isomerase [Bacteroidales bacterium]HOY38590.1 FKBP-type peptidyl-prolyl cis-trans isomerase [Bacteroidales bacterium]HQP03254.1 FKBP-type peptidyl-prolyl cis-trans isomerase [Bacteroidales bacterium]
MKIKKDSTVKLTYTLYFDNFDGEVFETIDEKEAMEFTMGKGEMLEEFEKRIIGMQPGDDFKMMIPMADAYGEESEEAIMEFPLNMFKDVPREELEPGNIVPMEDEDGSEFEALVLELNEDNIVLDFNHPLAGEDIYLTGKILDVK